MVHDTTPRHLRLVGDTEATDGVDLGVTYHHDDTTTDTDSGKGEPIEGRLLTPSETTTALTPTKAGLEEINARLRAALEAANTYALLAWARWMDATTGYVMDPHLRQDMLDDAERALDDKRVRAAKQRTRALDPAKKAAAEREVERLKNRQVSELEVDARVLAARGKRLAARFMWPAAVVAGPVAVAVMGGPLACFLAWPAAWAWLALQGRAHARADLGTTATQLEEKARHLATATTPAPPAPQGQTVGATDTENRILARLAEWPKRAPKRGLDGTTPGTPTLGETGLTVVVHTDGRLTPTDLIKKTPAVRALLGVPTDTAMDIVQGDQGDEALLRIRTRTPARDMTWHPGKTGIGIDVTTGEEVDLETYHRMLIAGASRSGKTVMLRVLMAKVAQDPNARLILIDAKRVEAARWKHVARTASTAEGISSLMGEIKHEMDERYREIAATGDPLTPSPDRPRMVIVVDEGAEVITMEDKETPIMANLRSLAMMGGEAEMHLWWCTQKPTMTGPGRGIDNAIAGQMTGARVCLRVTDPKESRTVLGEDANASGWNPHELERAGLALIRDGERGPDPVAVWDMSSVEHIRALDPREPWVSSARKEALADLAAAEEVAPDEEEEEEGGDDWIGAQGAVMAALQSSGPRTAPQLAEMLAKEYSKSRINEALKELQAAGRVTKSGGYGAAWRAL